MRVGIHFANRALPGGPGAIGPTPGYFGHPQPVMTFVLKSYLEYYNHRRPRQGLGQRPPSPTTNPTASPAAPELVRCRPVLGRMIRDYHLAA